MSSTGDRYNRSEDDLPSGVRRIDGFLHRETEFGLTLILPVDRATQARKYMLAKDLRRLEINHAFGFKRLDIGFLRDFAFLTGFEIIHRTIDDISPIHQLPRLENISIQTGCRTKIDFHAFPKLKYCRVYRRPGAKSIFDCPQLESLFLDYYKGHDIEPVVRLPRLRGLTITNGPLRSIEPIARLGELRELGLSNLRKLASLAGIEDLTALERLEVDGCPVPSADLLSGLTNLRYLKLCNVGVLASLRPLARLQKLEELYAWENTNVRDGDLSPLLQLNRLRKLALANRRHYSHRTGDIEKHLGIA